MLDWTIYIYFWPTLKKKQKKKPTKVHVTKKQKVLHLSTPTENGKDTYLISISEYFSHTVMFLWSTSKARSQIDLALKLKKKKSMKQKITNDAQNNC